MNGIHTSTSFCSTLEKLYGLKRVRNLDNVPKTMLSAIERTIDKDLTVRQYECFCMYYKEKLNVKSIAEELLLTPPTVSRHLQKARNKVFKAMKNFVEPKELWS